MGRSKHEEEGQLNEKKWAEEREEKKGRLKTQVRRVREMELGFAKGSRCDCCQRVHDSIEVMGKKGAINTVRSSLVSHITGKGREEEGESLLQGYRMLGC